MSRDTKLTVFYDGACPVCSREISFYRQCSGAEALAWVDASQSVQRELAPGLTKDAALSRFHVVTEAGELIKGGEAFALLWTTIPRFRMLGRVFGVWPLRSVLNLAYDLFLKFRPLLQAILPAQKESP